MAKRLTWIAFALALALYGILARPLVLGLDLEGGVTMRYELEAPDTRADGADLSEDIDATVETLRTRINAYGIRESSITRQGEREIVVELPGSSMVEADTVQSVISRVGHLEFRLAMKADGSDDDARNGMVVTEQQEALASFLELPENQGRTPAELNLASLDFEVPTGDVRYRWFAYSDDLLAKNRGAELSAELTIEEVLNEVPLSAADFLLIKLESGADKTFTGADISNTRQVFDDGGGNAVGVTISPARSAAFGDWTEPNIGRSMATLLDGRVAQPPANIQDRLDGQFRITSANPTGFSNNEIKEYLTVIKSGSLQMKPRLLYKNTIGPSLGEASIEAGTYASLFGFLAIIAFMVLYYRTNGVIASICLLVNMTLLTGILMFLGATLTLPGIAGLVLTLGMAVDANILIFERIREESDRAKSAAQAIKLGFEKAFSTIIDANVTTFVTAFILYKVGTGPVRGFSVILMLGIVTSVFSVLVVGRAFYETLVERGFENIAMGRLLKKETAIPFLSKGKTALRISAIVVLASLVAFFTADRDKYGLDFLGGYKAQVRLLQPAEQGDVIAALDGSSFEEASVISVRDDDLDGNQSTQFVIKLKDREDAVEDEQAVEDRLQVVYETPLRAALAGMIRPDFVADLSLTEDAVSQTTAVAATLAFEGAPDADRVRTALGFLGDLQVTPAGADSLAVSGTLPQVALDDQAVVQRLRSALDAQDGLPSVSTPFLESTMIGSTVGTELRDSAIRAILLSFIAIVLYIRVRFREYRYGFAAIVALFHDVSITLGVVALMHFSGIVDVEIDLAMIAAFLTIIGYSLNDTIVLFDRVRENLPRLKGKSYTEVLDVSINQTLARTLLTSLTTLAALVIIFLFNYGRQNVLEGFSFAMIIGVLVGTYSSIFVASPVLTMLAAKGDAAAASRSGKGTQEVPA